MDKQKRKRTVNEIQNDNRQKALSRRERRRQKMREKGLLKSQHQSNTKIAPNKANASRPPLGFANLVNKNNAAHSAATKAHNYEDKIKLAKEKARKDDHERKNAERKEMVESELD